MRILFSLGWLKAGAFSRKAFKSREVNLLFSEYLNRIAQVVPCEVSASRFREPRPNGKVWICERAQGAKAVSSEELSRELEKLLHSGCQELQILIGGPDGFSKSELGGCQPDFLWSFGPLTFPHELAALIAAEQIYRAWTILRNHPYHSGH